MPFHFFISQPFIFSSFSDLFVSITLYCKKTLAVVMNRANVTQSVTINGMYKISQSTNAKGQIILISTVTMIIMAKMIDVAHMLLG